MGYFGAHTPAGARYRNRSVAALALMVIGVAVCGAIPATRAIAAGLPGAAFAFIMWEWWRYVGCLDELERRLQLEAAAWSYGVLLFALMAVGGLGLIEVRVNAGVLILVEALRGWRLLVLARRHE